MADFNSLVADVFTITNRADLVAETQLAVKSATLQLHRSDFFGKDLVEDTLVYDTSDYLQSIPYRTLFPRYRALSYLRKYNPNYQSQQSVLDPQALYYEKGVGPEFSIISPDQIFDSYNAQRTDVCYVAGDVIKVKSSTADQYAIIGIYVNPEVGTPETYSSWIATESPYAIVYLAAASVFGSILGNTAKMNANSQLSAIAFSEVKNSNIVAKGY